MKNKNKKAAERISEILADNDEREKKTKDELRRERVLKKFNELSSKKQLEERYKFTATAYRLISEALHQGKNTYLITETLEYLELNYQELFDKLKKLDKEKENN